MPGFSEILGPDSLVLCDLGFLFLFLIFSELAFFCFFDFLRLFLSFFLSFECRVPASFSLPPSLFSFKSR